MPHPQSNPGLASHLVAAPAPLNVGEARWRIGFVLVPGSSYIAFASAIEPLRMANMAAHESLFGAFTCSADGAPVVASNGVRTEVDCAIDDLPALTVLFLCGPNPIEFPDERRLIHWLRRMAGRGTALGGIDTGSWLLARAGLLDGYRCTIHWQDLPSLTSDFPRIIASEQVFEIDRERYTCSGGTAAMDMMIQFIDDMAGSETAATVADLLVHERVRDRGDRQRIPLRHHIGTGQQRLSGAVALMEANVEEPMSLGEIAGYIGISERQLERLFETHLASTPSAFYMDLRLARARQLLLHTGGSIGDVAERSGFASAAHFSRRYRARFGVTPRKDRAGGGM